MVAKLPTDRQIIPFSEITLQLFESIGRGEPDQWLFASSRRKEPLTRQAFADRMKRWSVEFDIHLHPLVRVTVVQPMRFAVVATFTRFLRLLVIPVVTPEGTICRPILIIRLR